MVWAYTNEASPSRPWTGTVLRSVLGSRLRGPDSVSMASAVRIRAANGTGQRGEALGQLLPDTDRPPVLVCYAHSSSDPDTPRLARGIPWERSWTMPAVLE